MTADLELVRPQDVHHLHLRLRQLVLQASTRLERLAAIVPMGQGPSDLLADDAAAGLRRHLRDEIEAIASEVDYLDWAHAEARVEHRDGDPSFGDLGRRIGEIGAMIRELDTVSPRDRHAREAARLMVRESFRAAYARRRLLSLAWASPMVFLVLGVAIASQPKPLVLAAVCLAVAVALFGNGRINREFETMITKAEAQQHRLDML
jgi:hypothetical protein